MSGQSLKLIGVGCLVICALLLFVAWERYDTNAGNVQAVNQISNSAFGPLLGEDELKPATPAATKYALVFAVIAGGAGIVCLVQGGRKPPTDDPDA